MEKKDNELVELLTGDSREAFGELYIRYKERLMHICKRYLKDEDDVEDIVHDIFVHLWETRHTLDVSLSFSGFMQTITRNYAMDKLRHLDVHARFAEKTLADGIDSTNETEDAIHDNDYAKLLEKLIECLPPKQKEVYRLSRIEGLSYKEIAERLDVPADTVKKYAALALKKIKKQITQYADIHFKTLLILLILNF